MAPSSDYGKLIRYAASAQRFDGVQTPRRRQGLSYMRDNLKLQMILLTSSSETWVLTSLLGILFLLFQHSKAQQLSFTIYYFQSLYTCELMVHSIFSKRNKFPKKRGCLFSTMSDKMERATQRANAGILCFDLSLGICELQTNYFSLSL